MRATDCELGLTVDAVNALLSYDSETGNFTFTKSRSRYRIGHLAGYKRPDGYIQVKINNRAILAHRLAWFVTYGKWPNLDIDHQNMDKSDNRILNLRLATRSENCINAKEKRHNKSGRTGLFFDKRKQLWQANITKNRKRITIKRSKHKDVALAARLAKEKELFGPFARSS
jgi:HNH endonuclease